MANPTLGSGHSKRPDKPREFAFISGRASSVREKSKNSQLAHRHTARVVNRQRKLLRTHTSSGNVEYDTTPSTSGLFGDELHASSRSASVPVALAHGQVLSFDEEVDEELGRSHDPAATDFVPDVNWKAMTRPSFTQKENISEQMLRYLWLQSSSSPTRSLDSALGPMPAGMLQSASEPVYSLGIHHRKRIALDSHLSPTLTLRRLQRARWPGVRTLGFFRMVRVVLSRAGCVPWFQRRSCNAR